MPRGARIDARVRLVGALLKDYAGRGVFRSLNEGERRGSRTTYTLVWHHGLAFRFVLDTLAGTVCFPELLPGVPARSSMANELKTFLRQFQTADVPIHRRIDPKKARLRISIRRDTVSLALAARNGQFEYATRRLVHLAQEVFMVFLPDGPYYDYRIEKLGLDPDTVWA